MLSLLALSCPQCSAPLPRAARWRTVNCSYCGATITRGEETVERESFRAALRRANAAVAGGRIVQWRGARYRVLAPLGTGEHSEVLLAERLGAVPERVTLKLARDSAANDVLLREGAVLQACKPVGSGRRLLHAPAAAAAGHGHRRRPGRWQATGPGAAPSHRFLGQPAGRAAGQSARHRRAPRRLDLAPHARGAGLRAWRRLDAPQICRPRMRWCIRATMAC
jgi:hypothetical protein